jgi:integrase
MTDNNNKIEGIKLITEPAENQLNQRQRLDYRNHRQKLLKWLLNIGKDPSTATGYSSSTVRYHVYRLDKFYRWVWDREGYTTEVTQEHADEYMQELAYGDESNSHKEKCQQAIKLLFKWRKHQMSGELWEPEMTFSTQQHQPQDYFTVKERKMLREAALEYGSIPGYNDLSPEQRDRWKAHLAQRFEKPKSEVSPKDWKRANGWEKPTLVWVSLDAGLRPVEVENAVKSWVDVDNGMLRIPKEESAKNRENFICGLQDRTAEALKKYLSERQAYEKYRDTDRLWLTRERNPFQSGSLSYLLNRLCDIAGIDTEDRDISWYSIRHSVGTYMTHEEDLGAAAAQLRHRSEKTTLKYDQAPVEQRKDALDRMG